jgi:crossover junction endodeoxyribonuclease RuvC
VIAAEGNRLSHVANGQVRTDARAPLPERLVLLHEALAAVLAEHEPGSAAIEEVFVNENPQSTLKLGQARGVILLAAAARQIEVAEYAARLVKKAVVGTGGADKSQVHAMVARLLPGVAIAGADAADALAVAITHAHHVATRRVIKENAA